MAFSKVGNYQDDDFSLAYVKYQTKNGTFASAWVLQAKSPSTGDNCQLLGNLSDFQRLRDFVGKVLEQEGHSILKSV